MKQRYLFLLLNCFICVSGQAAWQGNGLLGISGVLAERKTHLDIDLSYTTIPLAPSYVTLEDTHRGYSGEILAGYQWWQQGWVVGAELAMTWPDIAETRQYAFVDQVQPSQLGWTIESFYEEKPQFALSGRVGFEVTSYFIPYIRLGVQTSKDRLRLNMSAVPVAPLVFNLQETQWHYHFLTGFGVEVPLVNCISLRLEYNYRCLFNTPGLEVNGFITGAGLNPAVQVRTQPRTQAGKISFVWNFA